MTDAPRPTLRARMAAPFQRFWKKLTPAPRVRRVAALGGMAGGMALAAWIATESHSGAPWYVEAGIGAGAVLIGIALVPLAVWLVRLAWGASRAMLGLGTISAWAGTALLLSVTGSPGRGALVAAVAVLIPALTLGGMAACFGGNSRWGKVAGALWALAGLGAAGFGGWWLVQQRGTTDHLVTMAPRAPASLPPTLAAADPNVAGSWAVATFTYGSGHDRHRPEFGAEVDQTTPTVDGSPFARWPKASGLSGWFGAKGHLRRRFWGFGLDELPLNGRVWHPTGGDGPFPIALVVHGNHAMGDFSDEGYGWLCAHLATRGYVAVSVDENFLNSSMTGGSLGSENDLRAWLLLQHLDLWRSWHDGGEHPLAGRVDMERIALIGHSRGGEAVALAAVFNRLAHYPDDAHVTFDFGFGIRAVAAIAPVDGQYLPADRRAAPRDVDFFTIHGAHDGDVTSFQGDRIYSRVRFSSSDSDRFKATAYVYRANHGQFNTTWGDSDNGGYRRFLLNRAALMSGEHQRQVGRTFLTAFLAASIEGQREYRRFLQDPAVGREWLPSDPAPTIVTRFESAAFALAAGFEEDVDLTTATAAGATIRTEGLTVWREGDIALRRGDRENSGVWLGWSDRAGDQPAGREVSASPSPPARFEIRWSADSDLAERASEASVLSLDIAEADEEPSAARYGDDDGDPEDEGRDDDHDASADDDPEEEPGANAPRTPLSFTVIVENASGAEQRIDPTAYGIVPPPLETQITRGPLDGARSTEINLQTLSIPLQDLRQAGFETDRIVAVTLAFDRSPRGVVVVDRIGFGR